MKKIVETKPPRTKNVASMPSYPFDRSFGEFVKGNPATEPLPTTKAIQVFSMNELSALSVRSLFQSAMPKVVRLSFLFTSSPLSPAMMT
jgi:hypothetical protein